MTLSPERELARLRARFVQRAHDLTDIGFVLKGSVVHRFKRCSSPGCRCQSDPERRHGPYWQWTNKVRGKTVSRALHEDQVERYREWKDNARRLDEVVRDLYDLSAQADTVLRDIERQVHEDGAPGGDPGDRAPSARRPRQRSS